MTLKQAATASAAAALTLLSGCGGGFFIDTNSTTSTTSSTGDYIYAVNPIANTISEYVVSSGTLTAVSGSPIAATSGLAAASVAVSRANTFVFVGGSGAVSTYSIGTAGALTLVTAQAASATATFTALELSPDGQWLLAMDALTPTIYVFKINTSTGALTLNQALGYVVSGSGAFSARSLRMSPTAAFVAASAGPAGDAIFSFNTSTGLLAYTSGLAVANGFSENAAQFDGTGAYLYIARGATTTGSSLIAGYTVNGNGSITAASTLAAGNAPFALLLESAGTNLYSANRADAAISGYTLSATTLTAVAGSPYTAVTTPSAMVEDKTHKYLIAVGASGGVDITLYAFDALTAGRLGAVATSTSGAAGLSAVASTHGAGTIQ